MSTSGRKAVDFAGVAACAYLLIWVEQNGKLSKNAASEKAGARIGIGGKYLQQISANKKQCGPATRRKINRAAAALLRQLTNYEPPRKRCRPEIQYNDEKEYQQFVNLTPEERRAGLLMYLAQRNT